MTREERELGLKRVSAWPRKDVVEASDLTPPEQELLVLAAALLNIRPGAPSARATIIEIP